MKRHQLTQARLDAIAAGLTTYQGNPCRQGHSGQRYASTRQCTACTIAARRQAYVIWKSNQNKGV